MGTGIWANLHWESGIWSLGMGITDRKTIELGLGFLKFGKTIDWEMGFGQNLGWENGIYTPPPLQDPLEKLEKFCAFRANTLSSRYSVSVVSFSALSFVAVVTLVNCTLLLNFKIRAK